MVRKARRLKITVLKRYKPEEVFEESPIKHGPLGACEVFEDGQEFIVEADGGMPSGFCGWA